MSSPTTTTTPDLSLCVESGDCQVTPRPFNGAGEGVLPTAWVPALHGAPPCLLSALSLPGTSSGLCLRKGRDLGTATARRA